MAQCSAMALLGVVLLSAPAVARQPAVWHQAVSSHFELYSAASERRSRTVLQDMERLYAALGQILGSQPVSALPIRVVLFPDRKLAAKFAPISLPPCAYFIGGQSHDYITFPETGGADASTIAHEVVHALITRQGIEYPLWLSEGLAVFYSTIEHTGRRALVGTVSQGSLQALRQVCACGIRELVSGPDRASSLLADPHRAAEFYARSWALTHMLLMDWRYEGGSSAFLHRVARGTPSEEAFSAVFGRRLDQVQIDLSSYLFLRPPRTREVTLRFRPPRVEPAIVQVSDLDVRIVLADLLLTMGRVKQAGEEPERLKAEAPDSWEVQFNLGRHARLIGRGAEARQRFAMPVALDAPHPAVHVAYAKALQQAGGESQRAREALETALALDPAHPEARYRMGLRLLIEGEASRAVECLAFARTPPRRGAFPIAKALAYAQYLLGRTTEARAASEQAAAAADTQGQRLLMEEFLRVLDGPAHGEAVERVRETLVADDAGY